MKECIYLCSGTNNALQPTSTHSCRSVRRPWIGQYVPVIVTSARSRERRRRIVLTFLSAWTLAVAAALAVTLYSLHIEDFDGLNNLWQIPFALPWFLIPLPALTGWSHEANAWVTAAMGMANGLLIAAWLWRGTPQHA